MTDEGPQDAAEPPFPPIHGEYSRPPYPTPEPAPAPPPPYGQTPYGAPPQFGPAPFGQQTPYGAPPQFGQAPYQAYGQPPYPTTGSLNPFDSRGTTILILGILGLVLCQLLAPVAWIMGRTLQRDAEAAGWPEPTTGKAGRICGIIGTAILAIPVAVLLVIVLVAIVGGIAGS